MVHDRGTPGNRGATSSLGAALVAGLLGGLLAAWAQRPVLDFAITLAACLLGASGGLLLRSLRGRAPSAPAGTPPPELAEGSATLPPGFADRLRAALAGPPRTQNAEGVELVEEIRGDIDTQHQRISHLIDELIRATIEIVGRDTVDLGGVLEKNHRLIASFVEFVVANSKQAMELVHLLDDLSGDMDSVVTQLEEIEGISRKTTMLALNSRIEAHRAGEHGRGFVVVADETRELAAQTRELAERINALVLQSRTAVSRGCELAKEISSRDMNEVVASEEQLDQVQELLNSTNRLAQQNAMQLTKLQQGLGGKLDALSRVVDGLPREECAEAPAALLDELEALA